MIGLLIGVAVLVAVVFMLVDAFGADDVIVIDATEDDIIIIEEE